MKRIRRISMAAIFSTAAFMAAGCCMGQHHVLGREPISVSIAHVSNDGHIQVANGAVDAQWVVTGGKLKSVAIVDKINHDTLLLTGDVFAIVLSDNSVLHASDMTVSEGPTIEKISGQGGAIRLADRFDGLQVVCKLHDAKSGLDVQWKAIVRDESNYVREEITLLPGNAGLEIGKIVMFDQAAGAAKVAGDVNASPLLLHHIFFGMESPMAKDALQHDWKSVGKWGKMDVKKNETTTLTYAYRGLPGAFESQKPLDIQFEASDGNNGLVIDRVTLLVDGKEVATDAHTGDSGDMDEHNIYHVQLPALHGGEKVELQASVKGDQGNDTIGDVTVGVPPAIPVLQCYLERNAPLKIGETLTTSMVFGAAPEGQIRRGFLAYIELQRAHPYRPFLHYNSWYDVGYFGLRYSEADCLNVVNTFNHELVEKRGVTMNSFLWDDGWDNPKTLWGFNPKLPNGFTNIEAAAAKHGADVGMWLSPFGGYGPERKARLEYGAKEGFETNGAGFSLSGPKYYQRFHDITMKFVRDYHANQFKFDGISVSGQVTGVQTRDGDAMLRLIADLRGARPDLFINQTTGTWATPFWLLYVDSTWRGGEDNDFIGTGSDRQKWITYRDWDVYRRVVTQGPLYPLNSLMLHGIVLATHAKLHHGSLTTATDADFRDEVRSYFSSGTQLQEMYITPSLMNDHKWDDIAASAKWSAKNAATLVDTHWIGGDPSKAQVYGWASWSPNKGILTLRNPADKEQTIELDAGKVFELPAGAAQAYALKGVYKDQRVKGVELEAGKVVTVKLLPYEVLVFEGAGR